MIFHVCRRPHLWTNSVPICGRPHMWTLQCPHTWSSTIVVDECPHSWSSTIVVAERPQLWSSTIVVAPSDHVCGQPISQKPQLQWYWLKHIANHCWFEMHPEKMRSLSLFVLGVVLNGLIVSQRWEILKSLDLEIWEARLRMSHSWN